MYICICFNINEKKIKEYIEKGYSLKDLKKETNITKKCGYCKKGLKKIYEENNIKIKQ